MGWGGGAGGMKRVQQRVRAPLLVGSEEWVEVVSGREQVERARWEEEERELERQLEAALAAQAAFWVAVEEEERRRWQQQQQRRR